jgi:hypothetical protein
MRKPYPTDLSDAEWNYIEPHMPTPKEHGRPPIHSLREILDAIFYVLEAVASGACYLTTFLDGPPFTTTSEPGARAGGQGVRRGVDDRALQFFSQNFSESFFLSRFSRKRELSRSMAWPSRS